ncbi:MAG: sensor histidine kinase [Ekhidna sp.]
MKNTNFRTHLILWICMYFYYVSSLWFAVSDREALLVADFVKICMQMMLAYSTMFWLIPKYLNTGKKGAFVISFVALLSIVFVLYTTIRFFYIEPTYPSFYRTPDLDFIGRITDFFYFFRSITWMVLPLIILIAIKYFRHDREIIQLKAEKKSAELNALKNQLNPHFLFNTLNNLYALSLKKSDQAPEVIAKLAEILDYILYRCNEEFVDLSGEINLLHNYIELEKVRYAKRLAINFEHYFEVPVNIAPLLLLTFVENAFKHGVNQEISQAKIDIKLKVTKSEIIFELKNSKPQLVKEKDKSRGSIGIRNIEKQLEILYANEYSLKISDMENSYTIKLRIPTR